MSDEDKKRLFNLRDQDFSAPEQVVFATMADPVPDWTLPRELQPQADSLSFRSGRSCCARS